MFEKVQAFHKDEKGDVVQTGIIIGLFAAIAVGVLVFLGPRITGMFDSVGDELDRAQDTMGTY